MALEEINVKNKKVKKYRSPLFNKTTLELSDLKNSPTRRPSNSVSRRVIPPRISSIIIEKNSFNENLIKFSKINGNQKLDTFLQTYDRIVNSIRIGIGNKNIIPKKKRITINRKFMHDLAKSRADRNVSLNINPCISMKPIISILLKSVEVVVNEKTKSSDDKESEGHLIEHSNKHLNKKEPSKIFTDIAMTESPPQSPSNVNYQSESNINSEELTEKDPDVYSNYVDSRDNYENKNVLKEGKNNRDSILKSNTIRQLYNSISHDISLIENLTKSDKELLEPISYSNDQSETLFIANQNIEVSDFDRENIKLEENGNNINGILFRTDSMSKLYKDIMNNNDLSADSSTIDKTVVDKTLVSDTPLKKEIYSSGSKDYYLSEVFTYSNTSDNNKPSNPKPKRKLNRNSSIGGNSSIGRNSSINRNSSIRDGNSNINHNSSVNENSSINHNSSINDNSAIVPPNPPTILRRNSSLNKKKNMKNKFIQKNLGEIETKVDDKVDVISEIEQNQTESKLHELEKMEEVEKYDKVENPEIIENNERIDNPQEINEVENPEKN